MARGILVSFAGYPVMASSLFPDNGLASLASVLIKNGHEVTVLDYNTVSTLKDLVAKEQSDTLTQLLPHLKSRPEQSVLEKLFDISLNLENEITRISTKIADEISRRVEIDRLHFVGFKLWSGDGFIASIKIAEILKKRFSYLKLYGGGPAVLYAEHSIYNYTRIFDALVDGEGELSIIGLANYAEGKGDLGTIPNLLFVIGNEIHRTERKFVQDLNTLPIPIYDSEIYPSLRDNQQLKYFVLDESRGCPMDCAYCVHKDASGNRWRFKSVSRVIEEIDDLHTRYGATCYRFGGSYTAAKFLNEFASEMSRCNYRISFSGFTHSNDLAKANVGKLAEAGCKSLFLGIESFDENDGKLLGKRLDPQKTQKSVQACQEAGIVPGLSLIVPAPGQTPEGLQKNLTTVVDLCSKKPSVAMINFPALIPRSRWWAQREYYGFSLEVPEDSYRELAAIYKIRHIIPSAYWQPLPYTLNNMTFAEFTGKSSQFQQKLAEAGVVLNVPDELVVLADRLNFSLSEMRKYHQSMFFCLSFSAISEFIQNANRSVVKP